MEKTANRNSWENQPLPPQRTILTVKRSFREEEYNTLAKGLIPKEMEDKWFIFMENKTLFFHRSWTGVCIYQVLFDDQRCIAEVWANRDPDQCGISDNEYDVKLLSFLIDNLLLGKRTPFPLPEDLPEDVPEGLYQHSVSGTGYPETRPQVKKNWAAKIKRFLSRK
ncbi:MAG: hypothetical protein PVF83_08220 [Anaerolineales bacterium]|jgi:hypothetical protein